MTPRQARGKSPQKDSEQMTKTAHVSAMPFGEFYRTVAVPRLKEKLGKQNLLALPRVDHVIVSSGVGKHVKEPKFVEHVEQGITLIAGQKPVQTLARKSIAGFKLRQGQVAGFRVTLRGKRMEDFLQKFIHVTLPRVRDFHGISVTSIDGGGNLSIGVREATAFPEVDPQKIETLFGLQVTIVTTAKTREEARALFEALGFPLTEASVEDVHSVGPQRKAGKSSSR